MYVFHYGNRTVQSHWFAILLTRASSMFAITLCNRTGLLCCFACIYVIYFATDASTGLNFLRWCVCLLRFVDRSSLSFGARVTCLSSATHRPLASVPFSSGTLVARVCAVCGVPVARFAC